MVLFSAPSRPRRPALANPDWLEADPKGTLERDDPLGWGTATWTAAPPVDFQPLGTQRSAPTGDVGAKYTTNGRDGPPETHSYGKVIYLYFQHPDVPRVMEGSSFDAPPDWAERSQETKAWAVRPAPTCPDYTG